MQSNVKILDVWKRALVWNGLGVHTSAIFTWPQITQFLGTMWSRVAQLLKYGRIMPSSNICSKFARATLSLSGARRRGPGLLFWCGASACTSRCTLREVDARTSTFLTVSPGTLWPLLTCLMLVENSEMSKRWRIARRVCVNESGQNAYVKGL